MWKWLTKRAPHICPVTPGIEVRVRIIGIIPEDNSIIMQADSERLAFLNTYGGYSRQWQEFVPTINGGRNESMIIAPDTVLVYEYRRT